MIPLHPQCETQRLRRLANRASIPSVVATFTFACYVKTGLHCAGVTTTLDRRCPLWAKSLFLSAAVETTPARFVMKEPPFVGAVMKRASRRRRSGKTSPTSAAVINTLARFVMKEPPFAGDLTYTVRRRLLQESDSKPLPLVEARTLALYEKMAPRFVGAMMITAKLPHQHSFDL